MNAPATQAAPPLVASTSLLLDGLRIIAAALVFAGHCTLFWYPYKLALGHAAVVVFFVLSGYVITFSAFGRGQRSARSFASARLARLYSVVIPALLLTGLLQVLGSALAPGWYRQFERGHEAVHYIAASVFLQNVWTLSASPATNTPFWSLSYEFWYYALFGVAVFVRRRAIKLPLLTLFAFVCGPNILLLMPCWLAGAALYFCRPKTVARGMWIPFVVCVGATVAAIAFLPEIPFAVGYRPMFFSAAFVTDWIVAAGVAGAIWFFTAAAGAWQPPHAVSSPVRYAADHTFSLYLYHYPLIIFVTALPQFNPMNPLHAIAAIAGILAMIWAISCVTEARRRHWRRAFERAWDAIANRRLTR